ncbi:MAG: saccharopine dehydrogenase family protein [Elainellaceae cyanobacterium]
MTHRVLILGGQGRIGSSVALDILTYTQAHVTITGRQPRSTAQRLKHPQKTPEFLPLELADWEALKRAIADADLVIHCAGPFHRRDARVLQLCIELGVNYLDVSDSVEFTRRALTYQDAAQQSGITAVINTGIFPGISNSIVRQGIEQFDKPETIYLGYVVGGSGGAGVTVMRTTFLGLVRPFQAWLNGQWHLIKPYSDRETIRLPKPYGKVGVYWYEMPETVTLAESFPVDTVITKFGSAPDFYNHLTWITAHWFPKSWLQNPAGIEFLSQVSYRMTTITDRFSGIGVGIQARISGYKDKQRRHYGLTVVHDNTAIAAGYGTGSLAHLVLSGKIDKPGVWSVEAVLPTPLFAQSMNERGLDIQHGWIRGD